MSFHKRDGSCFRAKGSASNSLGWVVVGFFILLDNVEVSGMVPSVPAILGITQCFRALSQ